jgi:hypothetical protein
MITQAERIALAARAIRAGTLPVRTRIRLWGGYGRDEACAVCGERITPAEVALELDAPNHPSMHRACEGAWSIAAHRESAASTP